MCCLKLRSAVLSKERRSEVHERMVNSKRGLACNVDRAGPPTVPVEGSRCPAAASAVGRRCAPGRRRFWLEARGATAATSARSCPSAKVRRLINVAATRV